MYVCVCRAVTDRQVKAAIEGGADSVEAVTSACEAGGDCGACHAFIEDMIEEHAEACGAKPGCSKRRLEIVTERERAA